MWEVDSILLNNKWVKEEITKQIRKYFLVNETENTTYENIGDAAKALLRGKLIPVMHIPFIPVNTYIK